MPMPRPSSASKVHCLRHVKAEAGAQVVDCRKGWRKGWSQLDSQQLRPLESGSQK
jgi:hypothetical protein